MPSESETPFGINEGQTYRDLLSSTCAAAQDWRVALSTAREAGLVIVHVLLVFSCAGSWSAVLTFFLVSWGVVRTKDFIPARLKGLYAGLGACVLAATLLVFRTFPHLLAPIHDGTGASRALTELLPSSLTFLGLSYCFLRVTYALLDDRRWRLPQFLRYYFFFPTFASGPIMAPQEMLAQESSLSTGALQDGVARMLLGTFRVTLAHLLSSYVPLSSEHQLLWSLAHYPLPLLWLGVFLSGVWLYLDFAGYSDIFIGGARLFGISAPENFDRPYAATDITAFWQRWHISLGNWLRTTIYTPLSRRAIDHSPRARTAAIVLAPIITMIICGAWHMLAWAFVIWGALHGGALAVHAVWVRYKGRLLSSKGRSAPSGRAGAWLLTHLYVSITWVFFLPVDPNVSLGLRLRLLSALLGMSH